MQYEIVRSKRKTMTIQVFRNQKVQIRAPLRCKDKEINAFLSKHRYWVDKKLQESQQYPGLAESQYFSGGYLWLLGEQLAIIVKTSTSKELVNTLVQLPQKIIVYQSNIDDMTKTRRLIIEWKRQFAANLFQQQLAFWFQQFPLPLKSYQFRLRKMKRQWGNCNYKGVITINSQLIRYPKSCIDYVLIHELAHLKHLNHSGTFYNLLEKVMPDWQQHKRLLSQFSGNCSLEKATL